MSHTAYIALGSNLGDRAALLRRAIEKLNQIAGIRVARVSTFLDNPAVGGPVDSPPFLNAAAEIQTDLEPMQLLLQLLNVERELGRFRAEKWGPRSIDLDLLLYDDRVIKSDGLVVPHSLMHQRRFVMEPLAQIAAAAIHPTLKQTIAELLESLQA